jgi:hypothetical protein
MKISKLQQIFTWLLKPLTSLFIRNQKIRHKPILFIIISLSLLLSGCVQYDLGINFNHANSGELVQHIQISEKLTSLSGDYVYEWLNSLERRAKKLQGSAKRISPQEVVVKIPFTNGKELQEKFNSFFNPRNDKKAKDLDNNGELAKIDSNLIVEQNNFLLFVRNRLIYDLDLSSLAVIASNGNVIEGTSSLVNLDLSLNTPFGAKNIQQIEDVNQPEKHGNQLVWQLQPGQLNHVEIVFWLPNFLGIGTLVIILLIWAGLYLRYTVLPAPVVEKN